MNVLKCSSMTFFIFILTFTENDAEIYLKSLNCITSNPQLVELSCQYDETVMNVTVVLKQSIPHILVKNDDF